MDPVLLGILLDGVTKCLTGIRQTKYIVGSNRKQKPDYWDRICQATGKTQANEEHEYWELQRNQEAIGWDNLLRGKFAKDWRKLNGVYNRKLKEIQEKTEKAHREQEKIREAQEKERDLYWDPMRPMKKKTTAIELPPKKKHKADIFQQVFQGIVRVIR